MGEQEATPASLELNPSYKPLETARVCTSGAVRWKILVIPVTRGEIIHGGIGVYTFPDGRLALCQQARRSEERPLGTWEIILPGGED